MQKVLPRQRVFLFENVFISYIYQMTDNDINSEIQIISEEPQNQRSLPSAQLYLLLFILIGYPLISIVMNLTNHADTTRVISRIGQIYLPSLLIQIILLTLVVGILKQTQTTLAGIGLGREDINWPNVVSGLIFFIGAWTLIIIIRSAIIKSGYIPEKDFLYLLPKTIPERVFWFFLSIGAAFSEEITFRGYAITRLRILTGSYWTGAILSSFAFSIGHLYQGIAGVLLTFIYGMLFAGLFVARKSVFPCIIAHFLQDALVLVALIIM
jgi:membrane protease YdiL (CAAX protease family)